jgi:SPP1 gp7 family putative phage head morphogenesis protein
MSIPEVFFRETIDLNRFSNAVAKKYAVTYNEVILNAAKQLREIDQRQVAEIAKGGARIIAPQTRKRLRAIIKQAKDSLNTWSGATARDFKKELQGITLLQRDFIVNELKKVTASGDVPINSVAISPKYAESVIMTDPTQVNIFTTEQFKEDAFKRFGAGKFELTATQGSAVTLPNGETVNKAFRGIAASSQEKLALAIRSGVFSGETTQQIARRLVGDLNFADFGPLSVKQLAASGGELTKLANHQIQTIVRTSVNQVQNQASQAVYAANSKVAPKYEYVATLDSKTTPICQRLDGQQFAYNKGPTPPQHFNCRSTTVPVVDFDGLQKKYPRLEKPPETALDTRPSITGRVPQNVAYGDWLLNQKKDLQIKTLGNEQRVRFFKRLANKKGSSGQKALRQIIRSDGTEKTLDQIKKEYKL